MLTISSYTLSADALTILIAAACVVIRCGQQLYSSLPMNVNDAVSSFLNGASVFPFFMLVSGMFSESMLQAAFASKTSIAIAGFVGMLFVCGEILSPAALKKSKAGRTICPITKDQALMPDRECPAISQD